MVGEGKGRPERLPRLTAGMWLRRLAGGKAEPAFCPAHELKYGKQGRLGSGLDQGQGPRTEIGQATGFSDQCPTLPARLGHSQARKRGGSAGREDGTDRARAPSCPHWPPPRLASS